MNFDSFQQLFPLVLLVIWVVVKALQQKKARRQSPQSRPAPRKTVSEERPRVDQEWAPAPDTESGADQQPPKRGDLYESMREAMEEYFGEAPAPAHREVVAESPPLEREEAAPQTQRQVPESVDLSDLTEERTEWATEPEPASLGETAPSDVAVSPAPVVKTRSASAATFPAPTAPVTPAAAVPSPVLAGALTQAASPIYVSSIDTESATADLESMDLRTAVVWSEILAAPVALRE